jgi:hypothetical protein
MALTEVQLGDQKDTIFWKWTPDKKILLQLFMIANSMGPSYLSQPLEFGGPSLSIKVSFLHDLLCIIGSL